MLGPDVAWYLAVAGFLFGTGALGVLLRRNPLIVLLSLEIMLNGGNLALIGYSRQLGRGVFAKRERGEPTVPSTIAEELATNPFLRCREPGVVAAAERHAGRRLAGEVEVFAEIRTWKNNF